MLWTIEQIGELFKLPMNDLLFKAQTIHRENFNPNAVQVSKLLSIKTGSCPEDCHYCPQSARYNTKLEPQKLLELETILKAAEEAKESGVTRFCMGAAWRNPKDADIPYLKEIISKVKALGLETCMTLGMLTSEQASALASAGLDYYNHNLDTSAEYYSSIITTRSYQDRLDTITNVQKAGMKVCTGGILGMGETFEDRVSLLYTLANMDPVPQSVPVNQLIKIEGTPLADAEEIDSLDFIKVIAVARILMPKTDIRLAAGREQMSQEQQALCFFAGVNSIFYGCRLLTAANQSEAEDIMLFKKLGLHAREPLYYDASVT